MKKPDPSRQYNLQLDSRLTITTKRRHLSSEPTNEKGLRPKYVIMTNLWLLAQMRQPGKSIYQVLDRCTFNDFLDTFLDRDNFNFCKEVVSRALIFSSWSFCLSYEFELRKEAFLLCKKQQYGIQAAFWATLHNTKHRMEHWLQLISIPKKPSSSTGFELQSIWKKPAPDFPWKSAETSLSSCWSGCACSSCSCTSPSRAENATRRKPSKQQKE